MACGREGAKCGGRGQNSGKLPHWAPPIEFFLSPKERNFLDIVKV
jgi:hypothetical protein